jgi:uncharacterized phiE125 gp8 family phage protein
MNLVLSSAPAATPVSDTEAKAHARITISDDDTLVTAMVAAATARAEAITGLSLITQTWVLYLDEWPADGVVILPRSPVQSVSSVAYRATDGTLTTLSSSAYQVSTASKPGRLVPAYGYTWPTLRGTMDDVVVTFVAGYGATGSTVPADIRAAILLMFGELYDHREGFVTGTIATPLPHAADVLLGRHRLSTVLVPS